MRLTVVALLGIEITILALASAASAATRPEGSQVRGSLYEAGPRGWEDGPAYWEREAVAAVLSDAYEVGPRPASPWEFEDVMADGERLLEDMSDWPAAAGRWPQVDGTPAAHGRPAGVGRANRSAQRVKSRSEADRTPRSPVRTAVVKAPRTRPHVAHRRAHVDLRRVLPRQAVHMSHRHATGWLRSAGLRTKSTGNCTSKHMHHCTSLDSVRTGTIAKVIELKRESRCPIMVTGGTERGHAPGQFSHGNGYKLDISHNACIDRHITKNHDKTGVRSDGATLYRSATGTTFADESDHWDILFR